MATSGDNPGRLGGARALVTGADSGIGKATAERLAAEGAAVAINYYDTPDTAEAMAAEIERGGGRAIAVQADVGNPEQVERMVGTAVEKLGGLDVLVNNAGIETHEPFLELTFERWRRVLATNLDGTFLCSSAAARRMANSGGGCIVNVSSVHQLIPWPHYAHYCASKGGIEMFSRTLALELAPLKIRVVLIAPGAIATPINRTVLSDPDQERQVLREIPWGRMGEPEEVAGAIAWLASSEAEYVTGSTLFFDGGMTCYPLFAEERHGAADSGPSASSSS